MVISYAEETNNCMASKRNNISVVAEQITGLLKLLQLTGIHEWSFLLNLHRNVPTDWCSKKEQYLPLSHFHFYVWYQEFHPHVHLDDKLVLNKECRQPKDDPSL
jgi:hypothetical protein